MGISFAQAAIAEIDETDVAIIGEWYWEFYAIDIEMKTILDGTVIGRHAVDQAAVFSHQCAEHRDPAPIPNLVDCAGIGLRALD